jgi:hypothetical protein
MTVRLGPDITYTALPYQLPAAEQATLRSLARNCHVYRALHGADSEGYRTATQALDVATLQMRSRIGVEVTRPEFLPIGVCA